MQSFRRLQLLANGCQSQRCTRHIGARVREVRDRVRADNTKHPVLVTLVKVDAQAPPLNIQQALNVLRLDICRRIQNDSKDVDQVHLWGFYNSSLKADDVASDMWMTLRSIGVPKPRHVYNAQQLQHLERRLPDDTSLVVDLSESGEDTGNSSLPVKSFLQTQSAELLRLSALLETGTSPEQAEGAIKFYRLFLSIVDNHVINSVTRQYSGDEDLDNNILQMLTEQEVRYRRHLSDFETRSALDVLWETMLLVKQHVESDAGDAVSPLVLLAAKERLVGHMERLGVSLHPEMTEPAADGRISTVIDAIAAFRRDVRSFALQDRKERKELMDACDSVRDSLLKAGIKLQDKKNQASWLWASPKK